ncbi:MAG: DUF2237 family protein [Candidatus Dadabacteria bacterium]|nr:DUF2237 family protein [Candidatus Dadabacteria bacterium]NIQ14528.1 DUF2237 family protein [Candidatus Dadabacteria bacterium]
MNKNNIEKNVLGGELKDCSLNPMTGFFRDGCCRTDESDLGRHVVCVEVTDEFLEFSKSRGNDLSTPNLNFHFPGLKSGDRWCLCALRWQEAYEAGNAPQVYLQSTHESALEVISLNDLKKFAIDLF